MENYSKLLIDTERLINGKNFNYYIKEKEFVFEVQPKNFDLNILARFNPKLNNDSDLKSRLENEIFILINNGGETRFESSLYSKNKGLRYYSISLKTSEDSNVITGVIYDITNEKHLLTKMAHAEKLRSIGELASGIAHDFNNHLMVITGSCELLELQNLTPKQQTYVNNILQSAKKSSELIKKLLQFSRSEDSVMQRFNLIDVINDAKEIMSHTTKNKTDINFTTNLVDAFIIGNISSIENSIINVVKNGIDAMNNGGAIYMDLTALYLDEVPTNSVVSTVKAGYYYKLEILDEGTGIPLEIMDKIFNPFFTTKDKQKGTGLGLSTVLSIILEHEGIITVDSQKGKGTKVSLYFKALDEPVVKKDRYTVMLVDDDLNTLDVLSQILSELSYRVISFNSPNEAIKYFKKNGSEIDILITDMRMPNMNGATLAKKVKEFNEKLPIIILSGYIDDVIDDSLELLLLAKPIKTKDLDLAIKKMLNI